MPNRIIFSWLGRLVSELACDARSPGFEARCSGVLLYSSTRMKASILLMLALVTVVSSSTSFRKVELGARIMSRVTSEVILGQRQNEPCSGLCLVHFTDHHFCLLGIEKVICDDDEYPVGPQDKCYCCIAPTPEE
ncbi:hypothetical protein FHG87_015903 [Trinorchestia longiramus]|nr:hypothetical protein FHG87_015903 [Trinorchestia longiramus]